METKAIKLNEQVCQINEILRSHGKIAVQEIKMIGREGNVIGQVKYGYKPQYVFDAVNTVLGAENWRHDLVKEDIFDSQAVAEVKLYLYIDGKWMCKGSQKGQSQIVKNNVGDAQKGAITNALLKCLSLISVGSDAYKGLLDTVYKEYTRSATKPSVSPPQTSCEPKDQASAISASSAVPESSAVKQSQNDSTGLPQIAGISYEERDGVVLAVGKGTFDKKDLLKAAGFMWDKKEKSWMKSAA